MLASWAFACCKLHLYGFEGHVGEQVENKHTEEREINASPSPPIHQLLASSSATRWRYLMYVLCLILCGGHGIFVTLHLAQENYELQDALVTPAKI